MINSKLPSHKFYYIFDNVVRRASIFISILKTSLQGSKKAKAGITIQAAMAVPLFLFAIISLLFLMEAMAIQTSVRAGLQYAGKELAKESYTAAVLVPSKLESDIVKSIGAERLNRSILSGGSGGIHCQSSRMSALTGIAQITAAYEIRIPIFSIKPIAYRQSMTIKGWHGYDKGGFENQDDETVYVTETGLVYHKDYHCTYLDLSIRMTAAQGIKELRNTDGEKYRSCSTCVRGMQQQVYITDTGNRYHNSLSCSGLKRTIYAVPVSEAVGKGGCSRCGR